VTVSTTETLTSWDNYSIVPIRVRMEEQGAA
jgi:hypothetical protein